MPRSRRSLMAMALPAGTIHFFLNTMFPCGVSNGRCLLTIAGDAAEVRRVLHMGGCPKLQLAARNLALSNGCGGLI